MMKRWLPELLAIVAALAVGTAGALGPVTSGQGGKRVASSSSSSSSSSGGGTVGLNMQWADLPAATVDFRISDF